MPRKPFETGLPRWASGKACPAKASPKPTLWRKTFSAASSANWFTCAGMTPAVLLKRIFSPISRPFTIRCARTPPLAGSHRALLNCACVMPLLPDLRDFTYYCDSFRFSRFLLSIFSGGLTSCQACPFLHFHQAFLLLPNVSFSGGNPSSLFFSKSHSVIRSASSDIYFGIPPPRILN